MTLSWGSFSWWKSLWLLSWKYVMCHHIATDKERKSDLLSYSAVVSKLRLRSRLGRFSCSLEFRTSGNLLETVQVRYNVYFWILTGSWIWYHLSNSAITSDFKWHLKVIWAIGPGLIYVCPLETLIYSLRDLVCPRSFKLKIRNKWKAYSEISKDNLYICNMVLVAFCASESCQINNMEHCKVLLQPYYLSSLAQFHSHSWACTVITGSTRFDSWLQPRPIC